MKQNNIRLFYSANAPEPGGHYSQAVIYNNTVYVSGQLPVNPFTGEKVTGSIEEQTLQVLENIGTILKDAGSDISKVVKTTVYITDINHWGRVNDVYAGFFKKHKPARAVVPVKELHHGFLIEVEAVAAL
jgi:2-iminobutanoate/2-iminopropanoate deaminase